MDPHEACALIKAHDTAIGEVIRTNNINRGIKGAQKRLDSVIKQLFKALVGRKPTPEELKQAQV